VKSLNKGIVTPALAALVLAAGGMFARSDHPTIQARHHPWASFPVGAWKLSKVETETLDHSGAVVERSVVETRTTLDELTDNQITLRIEVTLDVAGKRIAMDPQIVRQGYLGEEPDAASEIKNLGKGQVTIDGRTIDCQIIEVSVTTSGARTINRTYYSDTVAPFVLKTETRTVDLATESESGETTTEVVSMSPPRERPARFPLLRRLAQVRAERKSHRGRLVTRSIQCCEVPGGIVYQASEEYDRTDRLIRQSVLEVVDYGSR
jgi:hypothetical protein